MGAIPFCVEWCLSAVFCCSTKHVLIWKLSCEIHPVKIRASSWEGITDQKNICTIWRFMEIITFSRKSKYEAVFVCVHSGFHLM